MEPCTYRKVDLYGKCRYISIYMYIIHTWILRDRCFGSDRFCFLGFLPRGLFVRGEFFMLGTQGGDLSLVTLRNFPPSRGRFLSLKPSENLRHFGTSMEPAYHLSWCCHKTMVIIFEASRLLGSELKALVSGREKSPYRFEHEQIQFQRHETPIGNNCLPVEYLLLLPVFVFFEPVWWEVAGVKCLHHWSLTCFNWRSKPGKGECCWKAGFSGSASLNFRGVKLSGCKV